ncbi:MAG: Brix domain containing protein, partial [Thermoprotei archaeon]
MKAHIIVTTTHHINPRVRSLANELARALPDAVRINRGKQNIINLAEKARLYEAKS